MVCVVKDCATGQIIPSCTTLPTEGMMIDTTSDEVADIRTMSLELLLSAHRADCEAPCTLVCPHGLDIEMMLRSYDKERYEAAFSLIDSAFVLSENPVPCDDCKVPCEKACRRKTVDAAVSIREIIKEVISHCKHLTLSAKAQKTASRPSSFMSRLGLFSDAERDYLKVHIKTASRCLHCACAGQDGCKLRLYATSAGIKRSRYDASSATTAMKKIHIRDSQWFEPAKCIHCGLCVYNTADNFTFRNRGFGMTIFLPDENRANISDEIASICPTGAIYSISDSE
jgi:predicted molibdopterin-dependent oxidoreductase YjgC